MSDFPSVTDTLRDDYGLRHMTQREAAKLSAGDSLAVYQHHVHGGLHQGIVHGHINDHMRVTLSFGREIYLSTDAGFDPDFDSGDEPSDYDAGLPNGGMFYAVLPLATPVDTTPIPDTTFSEWFI